MLGDYEPVVHINTEYAPAVLQATQEYETLQLQYQGLLEETERLKTRRQRLEKQIKTFRDAVRQQNRSKPVKNKPKDFGGRHLCPFKKCAKEYGSELALNHHMREKHNAGTKTERETLGRKVVLAEFRGQPLPQIAIQFPPGFLNELRRELAPETAPK